MHAKKRCSGSPTMHGHDVNGARLPRRKKFTSKSCNRGVTEKSRKFEPLLKFILDSRHESRTEDRIAAEIKKIVVDPDLFDLKKVLPRSNQFCLDLGAAQALGPRGIDRMARDHRISRRKL